MNNYTVGAVVRCGDLIEGVYAAVRSLQSGTLVPDALIVVADSSTPRTAEPWLAAFCRARRLGFLKVDVHTPGPAWNAALGAVGPVDFALCVHAGETLDASALEIMTSRLSSDPAVAAVTSGIEWVGPGSQRTFTDPTTCSATDILGDPLAVHSSSVFRWSQWRSCGGFDEAMPALEHADLWLKLIKSGGVVVAEKAALLRRRVHRAALYRRTWLTGDYRCAAYTLFERHAALAFPSPGVLLELKERAIVREFVRHRSARARAHEAEQETARLTARRDERLIGLPGDWKPALDLGSLARTSPLSHDWGYERGAPADRPLIERYLASHAEDIHGAVLEVQEDDYTRRFGGARVERSDVLDVDAGNPQATIVGDLRAVDHIASGTYDCIILTQTLHVIDDMRAVVRECERLLKPGGVMLATLPSASRVCLEYGPEADYWRATDAGARRLFADVFPASNIETTPTGNALVNAAFGFGLASEELPAGAYESNDPFLPVVIGVRATKSRASGVRPDRRPVRGVALLYHRVGAGGPDPHRLSVSAATFRAQLDWLRSTCSVVTLDELARGEDLPPRAVAMTFDDGYVDNLSVAVPLLREVDLPATFFLTTGEGQFPYHYWWDRLAAALVGPAGVPSSLTIELPSGRRELATSSEAERLAAHWLIYHDIVWLPVAARESVVGQVTAWAGIGELDVRDRRMTWSEVGELMSTPRHSIGAHTVDHLYLPAQPDEVLMRELADSRAALERQTGATVDTLAYPFGAVDERTVAAARAAGFRLAVTCREGGVLPSTELLLLPRVEVTDGPMDRFIARVEQALGPHLVASPPAAAVD